MGGVIGLFALGALVAVNLVIDRFLRRKRRGIEREAQALAGRIRAHKALADTHAAENRKAEGEQRSWAAATVKAEQELRRVEAILAARRTARPVRYHVFDRLEGRHGAIWLVTVDASGRGTPWTGRRRYLVVADTERLARERTQLRFSRTAGYQVAAVAPSPLTERIVQMQAAEFGNTGEPRS